MEPDEAPVELGAYMADDRAVWLCEPNPPLTTPRWRLPGGFITTAGTVAFNKALATTTKLRKMVPRRN